LRLRLTARSPLPLPSRRPLFFFPTTSAATAAVAVRIIGIKQRGPDLYHRSLECAEDVVPGVSQPRLRLVVDLDAKRVVRVQRAKLAPQVALQRVHHLVQLLARH